MNVAELSEAISITVSDEIAEPAWDAFLESTPMGQFQQSSSWAKVKAGDGWNPIRSILRRGDQIIGGFQILTRKKGPLTIGYISKGPVLLSETPEASAFVLKAVRDVAVTRGIAALVIQPPDQSEHFEPLLAGEPYSVNSVFKVNEGTLYVEVGHGLEALEEGMSKYTRKNVRQAVKKGVTVREGGESDLPTFFKLMVTTCERQGAAPNPSSVEGLQRLWAAFAPEKRIRLSLAEVEGTPVAGQLAIGFGKMLTLWKKGWDGSNAKSNPNDLLGFEVLQWAAANGFERCDFASLDRKTARALLSGVSLDSEEISGRDRFNLGFGGQPKILPQARVYIANPIFRFFYNAANANQFVGNIFRRYARA